MRPSLTLTFTLLAASFLATPGAAQATIGVPGDQPSIQAAINIAASGDTILVQPGTYSVSKLRFFGKAVTLASAGGPGVTALDGGALNRLFLLQDGEGPGTIVDGFRIQNGRAPFPGGTVGDGGGAVLLSGASPWFRNCEFVSNRADDGASSTGTGHRGGHGGALYLLNSSARFESCLFEDNEAGTGGQGGTGAVGSAGTLFLPTGGTGGAGKLGGRGGHGGAVYVEGASAPSFVNCGFARNDPGRGGRGGQGGKGGSGFGLSAKGGNGGKGGTGGQGGDGALYVSSGATALVVNSTFFANPVGERGSPGQGGAPGSASAGSGNPGMTGSSGAFGDCTGVRAVGVVEVQNSTLWDPLWVSTPEVLGNAIVWNSNVYGGFAGAGNTDLDPVLNPTTLEPLAGSPLIDASDTSVYPAWAGDRDLAASPRSFDRLDIAGSSGVDIGAVENTDGHQQLFPAGCQINQVGSLSVLSGTSEVGQTIEFGVDNPSGGQEPGSISLLMWSLGRAPGDCGFLIPGFGMAGPAEVGALLIDPTPGKVLPTLWGPLWSGPGAPASLSIALPADQALVGFSLYVQGALYDFTDFHFGVGEALQVVIGT